MRELGGGPAGPVAADELAIAIATRFGTIERGRRFDAARPKLARSALVPSRAFDETGFWTRRGWQWRELAYFGHRDGEAYRLDVRPSAPAPTDPGDYRGRLRLRRIADGRYEWAIRQELAVGSVRPERVAQALTRAVEGLEGVSAHEARTEALEAFPRASSVLSRLYHLETLDLTPEDGGATAVRVGVRLDPDGLRETAPRYAAFLDKVARPMRVRAALCDESGAPWWRLELSDLLWTLHLRLRGGSLVPLEGPAQRRLPPHVRLTLDLSSKVGIFTVGVRRMVADVTLTRTSGEKGCVARFRCTPDWRLPFLIEPFLRGSLSYPFEGVGSFAGFAIRGSTGQPTRIIREYGLRVRESRIVRWMGGLGSSVLGDFRKGAESESDRYSRECLYALRDDLVSVLNEPAAR